MKYLIKYQKEGHSLPSFTIIYSLSYDKAVAYANNLPSIKQGRDIKVTPVDNIIAEALDVQLELLVQGIGDLLAENNLEVSNIGEVNLYELLSTMRNIINESIKKRDI